jgi:putative FmdB family regulatory protein
MPLYEYQCDNCNEKFEVMQKFADAPLTSHEKCGGGPVHRLISTSAFSFKGSGWYVNDYGKGKSPAKESKESSSSSPSSDSSAKSSESSKESKPASDSPSKSSPPASTSDTK